MTHRKSLKGSVSGQVMLFSNAFAYSFINNGFKGIQPGIGGIEFRITHSDWLNPISIYKITKTK
jgi:hypothetical protein